MKNIYILTLLLTLLCAELIGQSVPEGMRFQAVARNMEGNLLQQESLEVLVELFSAGSREKLFFSELHEVRSSEIGLLDFIIGEGNSIKGKLSKVPWGKREMWVRISVKTTGEQKYQIVSSGQLYSVPYALYAESAGSLEREGSRSPQPGKNSINWNLEGNKNADNRNDGNPVLGTTDDNDLRIITSNIPRIIIDKAGEINFIVNTGIGGDLNVDGTTTLNNDLSVASMASSHLTGTLQVDKETVFEDALFVQNMAVTHFTGSLKVGQSLGVDGTTTLNNSLDAQGMGAVNLGGTLRVDRVTQLSDSLTVDNSAPTHFTGDLQVDGDIQANTITIEDALEIGDMHPSHLTGTLDVEKEARFASGLNVSGEGVLAGQHLAYFENENGGNADGVAIQLANNYINKENNYLTFYRHDETIAGRVEGYAIGDIADIPVPTNDEIWTAVCIGVADYNPMTIAWTVSAGYFNTFAYGWNNSTIPSFDIPDVPAFNIPDVPPLVIPDVPAFVIPNVPGFVIPDIPGVVIPNLGPLVVGPYLCANIEVCVCPCDILDPLNFDCCCVDEEICLVPNFTLFPELILPDFPGIPIPDFPGIPIPDFPGIAIPDFPGIVVPDFPGIVIPATPAINLSSAIGTIPTVPTFSDILVQQGVCPDEDIFNLENGYFRRLANWAFEHRLQGLVAVNPLALLSNAITWSLTSNVLNNGIVYGSKGADYAEYLPKLYTSEQFMKGEVVGIYSGRISKNTIGADQILAITSQPLVLGNMPESGNTENFEKVAFLGQIPVFVRGPVQAGDYIVPSGKNDGIAIAVSSQSLSAELLPLVLGTAWSEAEGEGISLINTSIGLRPMEIGEVLKQQAAMEDDLMYRVQSQRSKTETLSADLELIKRAAYNP